VVAGLKLFATGLDVIGPADLAGAMLTSLDDVGWHYSAATFRRIAGPVASFTTSRSGSRNSSLICATRVAGIVPVRFQSRIVVRATPSRTISRCIPPARSIMA